MFPHEVFLGAVIARDILPAFKEQHRLHVTCESALVPAVLELALAGAGIAWLPRSACREDMQSGALRALDDSFGIARMNIVAARIAAPRSQLAEFIWQQLRVFSADSRFLS